MPFARDTEGVTQELEEYLEARWPGNLLEVSVDEKNRIISLLETAPGPAFWYSIRYPHLKSASGETLQWVLGCHSHRGVVLTSSPSDKTIFMALDMYSTVISLDDKRFIAQFLVGPPEKPIATRFLLYDSTTLEGFKDSLWELRKIRKNNREAQPGAFSKTKPLCSFDIQAGLEPGTRNFVFPSDLGSEEEILALSTVSTFNDGIYILRPREGKLSLAYLDWFNDGGWDFGYQWITCVTRDPDTGNIVGEGFRMGVFVLDPTGDRLLGWIVRSPFFRHGELFGTMGTEYYRYSNDEKPR